MTFEIKYFLKQYSIWGDFVEQNPDNYTQMF